MPTAMAVAPRVWLRDRSARLQIAYTPQDNPPVLIFCRGFFPVYLQHVVVSTSARLSSTVITRPTLSIHSAVLINRP